MEAAKDYSITMNNMIFENHMEKQGGELVPHSLVLPAKPPKQ